MLLSFFSSFDFRHFRALLFSYCRRYFRAFAFQDADLIFAAVSPTLDAFAADADYFFAD